MTSKSFLVSCIFDPRFCDPPEVKFDVFGISKHREARKIIIEFFFLAILISFTWRFYRVNKKKLSYLPLVSALVSRSSCLGSSAVGDVVSCYLARHFTVSASQWVPANVILNFQTGHGWLRRFVWNLRTHDLKSRTSSSILKLLVQLLPESNCIPFASVTINWYYETELKAS